MLFWNQAEAIEKNIKVSRWFNCFLTFYLFIIRCAIAQVSIENRQPAYTKESSQNRRAPKMAIIVNSIINKLLPKWDLKAKSIYLALAS